MKSITRCRPTPAATRATRRRLRLACRFLPGLWIILGTLVAGCDGKPGVPPAAQARDISSAKGSDAKDPPAEGNRESAPEWDRTAKESSGDRTPGERTPGEGKPDDGETRPAEATENPEAKVVKTDEEWKEVLTSEQYYICRQKGTERAFTGAYWNEHREGQYLCVACGNELFGSGAKFDSGTGWPSFFQPATAGAVASEADDSLGTRRTEVLCSRCESHLGHVFDDGPRPTGLRYCINSAALKFVEKKRAERDDATTEG